MTSDTRHIELHYAGDFDAGQELLNIDLWSRKPNYLCNSCGIYLYPDQTSPMFTPFAAALDDTSRWLLCQDCLSPVLF